MAADLQPPAWTPYSQRSLCEDFESEWRTRKISIMGVVRSFVSQLKPGQDLTRVSIPVALLFPFSMLEIAAVRETGFFNEAFVVNILPDPRERMLAVCRWYLCTVQSENLYKKPYNSILGEMHQTWTSTSDHKKTYFLAEQVSHHPPISALVAHNPQEDVTIYSTASFSVKLQTNNAVASVEGSAQLTFGKLGEKYLLSRRIPDTKITNVIIGTRRMFWMGEVTISCPKTGLSATIAFKEKGNENVIRATVFADADPSDELFVIEGRLAGAMQVQPKGGEKRLFADVSTVRPNKLHYPDPKDLDVWSSQVVWAEANKYIVIDDIEKAEDAKKRVENQQRQRAAARQQTNEEWTPRFFVKQDDIWVLSEAGWKKLLTDYDRAGADEEDFGFDPLQTAAQQSKKKPPSPALLALAAAPQRRASSVDLRPLEAAAAASSSPPVPVPSSASSQHQQNGQLPAAAAASSSSSSPVAPTPLSQPQLLADGEKGKLQRSSMRIASNVVPASASAVPSSASSSSSSPALDKLAPLSTPELDEKGNIMGGWMKLRNAMKVWKTRWFVLRPGRLLYFKQEKHEAKQRCVGILELRDCRVYARPTVKEGFAFKLENVLSHPIYAKTGLKGEGIPYARMPVGSLTSAIMLVGSEPERKSWLSAIQEQITYATTHRNGGTSTPAAAHASASSAAASSSSSAPAAAAAANSQQLGDVSDDEESIGGPGVDAVLQRYDESQRQLFAGLAAQQVKIQRSLAKNITELGERLETIEKRLGNVSAAVNRGAEASGVSLGGLLLYIVLATVLAVFVVRFLGRYLM